MSLVYMKNLCDRTLKARAVMKSKNLPPPFQGLDNSSRVYPNTLRKPSIHAGFEAHTHQF